LKSSQRMVVSAATEGFLFKLRCIFKTRWRGGVATTGYSAI
jgi:hypothetical protein